MNRFVICLALPFVIWAASKVDTDLAFACFCSSFFYAAWCGVWTMIEVTRESEDKSEKERLKAYDKFIHKYPGAPPKGQD